MENRLRLLLLKTQCLFTGPAAFVAIAVTLVLASTAVIAGTEPDQEQDQEQVIEPQIDRRTIHEAKIDTEDFETGFYVGLMSVEDFGANVVVGIRFAYHVTEDFFVEMAYGTTDTDLTSYERLSGTAQLLTQSERTLTYYNMSVGYNILPGETFFGDKRAYNSDLYLIAGVGSTEFAGDTRFTMNFGAGYRLLVFDWVAIHADVRDHLFDIDVTGIDKMTNNIEIQTGLTLFF